MSQKMILIDNFVKMKARNVSKIDFKRHLRTGGGLKCPINFARTRKPFNKPQKNPNKAKSLLRCGKNDY